MPNTKPYLDSRLERGVLVLTVTRRQVEGEDVASQLKDELLAQVAQHNASSVVLDLSATQYVSSIAFWPLLALRKQLAEKGGRVVLCGLCDPVREVFTTTRMISGSGSFSAPFELAQDREAAVARLAPRGDSSEPGA